MKKKAQAISLSIVIPVYNEEDYLGACLDTIAKQNRKPKEVIVVDNNCADRTIEIAKKYKFVKVVKEPKQGKSFARNTGFDNARSDVIGRIDADTILPDNWVEKVTELFEDEKTIAVTGPCSFYDFPMPRLTSYVHRFFYYHVQAFFGGGYVLWGSNMAVRKDAWSTVSRSSHNIDDHKIHEDIDLALKLRLKGMRSTYIPSLTANVSMRRGEFSILGTAVYLYKVPVTYWKNSYHWRAVYMAFVWMFVYLTVLPFLILRRVIDSLRPSHHETFRS